MMHFKNTKFLVGEWKVARDEAGEGSRGQG